MENPVIHRDVNVFVQNACIGQYISVEIMNKGRERFKSSLIGMKNQQYLMLELPHLLKYGSLRDQLLLGQALVIRTICEKTTGECMGFRTNVEGVIKSPYPVFFATFPAEVETRELRNEKRSQTIIAAHMFKQEESDAIEGVLTDISAGGCCFELEVEQSVAGIKAKSMYLRFIDPESGQIVRRLGKICSQRKEGNRIALGFAFVEDLQATG